MNQISVCPSVKCVKCDKTKENFAHILTPNVATQQMVGGGCPLLSEILDQIDLPSTRMAIANLYLLVAPHPHFAKKVKL